MLRHSHKANKTQSICNQITGSVFLWVGGMVNIAQQEELSIALILCHFICRLMTTHPQPALLARWGWIGYSGIVPIKRLLWNIINSPCEWLRDCYEWSDGYIPSSSAWASSSLCASHAGACVWLAKLIGRIRSKLGFTINRWYLIKVAEWLEWSIQETSLPEIFCCCWNSGVSSGNFWCHVSSSSAHTDGLVLLLLLILRLLLPEQINMILLSCIKILLLTCWQEKHFNFLHRGRQCLWFFAFNHWRPREAHIPLLLFAWHVRTIKDSHSFLINCSFFSCTWAMWL